MRVLVTGGAGFLGSNLIETLLEQKHEVLCVDNFYTGSKYNLEHFCQIVYVFPNMAICNLNRESVL